MFLAYLASWLIRLLCLTWSVRLVGPEPEYGSSPLIFCFWHGRQAGLFAHPRPRPIAVLASLSRDGALQARILSLLGFKVCRGSSSRGGAAGLKALINTVQTGTDAAFAVDGPRGPAFNVKPGAIVAAEKTSGTLIPITTRAKNVWIFDKAWDVYRLPKPFARVELVRANPIPVKPGQIEKAHTALQKALSALETEAS